MLSQELEFAITQYLDGTLAPQAKVEVEKLLRENPQARTLFEEYKRLDALVISAAGPLPSIDWTMLGKQISSAVAEADRNEQSARVYRIGWISRPSGLLALAASLLIVIGATVIIIHSQTASSAARAEVTGPHIEVPAGSVVAEVTIIPPPMAASEDAQDIVARRPHINIEAINETPEMGHTGRAPKS